MLARSLILETILDLYKQPECKDIFNTTNKCTKLRQIPSKKNEIWMARFIKDFKNGITKMLHS